MDNSYPRSWEPRVQSGMETADKKIQGVEQALHKLSAAALLKMQAAASETPATHPAPAYRSVTVKSGLMRQKHRDTMHLISIKPWLGLPSLLLFLVFFRGTLSKRANAQSTHFSHGSLTHLPSTPVPPKPAPMQPGHAWRKRVITPAGVHGQG